MAQPINAQYELIESLPVPSAGFARSVLKARQTTVDARVPPRVVLLRSVPPEIDQPAFRNAVGLSASLPLHPHILPVFSLMTYEGSSSIPAGVYVVSDFARGITLRERIRRVAPFSLGVTLDISVAVAQAVLTAHQTGVRHGNLSPDMVLLTPEGQVKVSDFAVDRAAHDLVSQTDVLYDDDVRSIGLLVYEMLTGAATSPSALHGELSLQTKNPDTPAAIEGIVRKATSDNFETTYATISKLLSDLQAARDDLRAGRPLQWTPLSVAPHVQRTSELAQAARDITAEQKHSPQGASVGTVDEEGNDDREYGRLDSEPERPNILGRVILGLSIVLVAGFVVASVYVASLFNTPADVLVPNLIGKQLADAQAISEVSKFTIVVAGHNFSDTWPIGEIYQMTPAPGRSIKSGKDVDVYVSDGPMLATVPDVRQMTQKKALSVLQQAGFTIGTVATTFSDSDDKGIVIDQHPAAAARVPHQSAVNLTVSKGPSPPNAPTGVTTSITIPGEIDISWDDVDNASEYNVYRDGVKIASGVPQASYSDENVTSGNTYAYSVSAVNGNGESPQSQSSSITDTVPGTNTPAPPPDVTPPPPSSPTPDSGQSPRRRQFDIRFKVPSSGKRHNVQVEVEDATGTNIVYDEDRDPGDTLDENISAFGNKVVFLIFIDGKLAKQETK
jgi:serine/threonine-protein kinase